MYSVYSSFVFLILTTVFGLGHCDGNYTEFSEIDCTREIRSAIRAVQKNAICKPRYTFVALNPKPGQTFLPSSVSVPQCSGLTSEGVICAPQANGTRITQVHISVNTRANDGSSEQQCAVVNIKEHTACEHTCIIKETDCNAKLQRYDGNRCKCVCKDEVKKVEGGSTDNKNWNEEDCKWECKTKIKECMNGRAWNDDHCKCL